MALSSFAILGTSFCVQKERARDVSSTYLSDISEEVKPIEVITKGGHRVYVFHKKLKDEPVTIIQVKYQCANSEDILNWDSFEVMQYLETAIQESHIVLVKFQPIPIMQFNIAGQEQTKKERESAGPLERVYDLSHHLACGN